MKSTSRKLTLVLTLGCLSANCTAANAQDSTIPCSLTITSNYVELAKMISIVGTLNASFTNSTGKAVKTVTISALDGSGQVLFTNEFTGSGQSLMFMAGQDRNPTPIESGATSALTIIPLQVLNLRTLSLYGADDTKISEAVALMDQEVQKAHEAYNVSSCRIDGVS